jgi:hypothetical protein
VKTAFFIILFATTSVLASEDMSLEAHLGNWTLRADTEGLGDRVVTRVFAERTNPKMEAQMELPFDALYILTEHLSKLPKKRFIFGHIKLPKNDYVHVSELHDDIFTSATSLALFRLWLDDHRAQWNAADSPELEKALRTKLFPPPK